MTNTLFRQLITACLLALLLVQQESTLVAADAHWLIDFEAARKQAAQQNKDLLIDFTGSDWCPPCIALHKNVFSKAEFTRQMSQHYVFITLDFPRDKSKQAAKTITQNAQLNKRYKIRGFPTIILADASGKSYDTQVGYPGNGLDSYMRRILDVKGKRDGKTYKLNLSGRPEMTADGKAFDDISKAVKLRRARYLIFCTPSPRGMELIDQFLARYPKAKQHAEVTYLKAISLWNMGKYEQAAPAYRQFLDQYPKHDLASLSTTRLIQSHVRSDHPQRAVQAIEALPGKKTGGIVLEWAQALCLTDRSEEGIKQLETYITNAKQSARLSREVTFLEGQLAKLQMIGQPLNAFEIKTHRSQQTITPATLKGKVVLVDFWATWCSPCLAELPRVKKVYQQYQPRGFEILGISLDKDKAALDKMLADRNISWPQFFDGNGWKNQLAVQMDVHRIPFAVLVDAEGIVRYVNVRGPAIERLVRKLIESQATGKKTSAVDAVDSPKRRVGRIRRGRRGAENVRR
jgi:thiol-disulfide isomerase/thioredoxin